uniref:Unannotated protein n=1 Tax=freshwater metagenome TaxID=449393 RepID=A0A6J5ZJG6_9ZZZZ
MALLLSNQADVVLALNLCNFVFEAGQDLRLVLRDHDVVLRDCDSGERRVAEAKVLERVKHHRDGRRAVGLDQRVDDYDRVALADRLVDELVIVRVERLAEGVSQRTLDAVVVDDAADGCQQVTAAGACGPVLGEVVEIDDAAFVQQLSFLSGTEDSRTRPALRPLVADEKLLLLRKLCGVGAVGQVVRTEHHLLGRRGQRDSVGRREDVVRREHQDPGFGLSFGAERYVNGHLVAVEVGVERMTDERVNLNRLAFDEHGLKGLDAETVKRRCAVQQHRVLADDVLENVPHLGHHRVDHLLGGLDVLSALVLNELGHDERLEQLKRHQLRQTALVELEVRTGDNHRAAGVVDALAEQVLTEASLLALKHVGERLQRTVARSGDGTAATAVVEECVNCFLQHAALVVDDDLGRTEVKQALEAVVAVDHAPVEVVQVGGREAAAVELDHRAKLRWDHRNRVKNHHLRLIVGAEEC